MKIYEEVVFSKTMINDLGELADFIVSLNTPSSADQYIDQLKTEISTLAYLADCLPPSNWEINKRHNENAKHYITDNKKWHVIFHTTENKVIVDKLIPSKMIIR